MNARALPWPFRHVAGAGSGSVDCDADVIILALGRATETEDAIRSALDQTGVAQHVYVLDQGSEPAVLARFAALIAGREDATLVRSDRNLGVAGGRNLAASLGGARIIVALDNDAVFADATTLARAVACLDHNPGLAAIGFRILAAATGTDDLSAWGYPMALLPRAGQAFDAVTFVGAGHAIRRSAWDEAGGYDDSLFFCWEEYDFCLRAIDRGWGIRYQGDIVVHHRVSPEHRVAWSGTRWFFFVRNRLYIEHKWGTSWARLLPRFCGYLLRGLRQGKAGPILHALLAAIALSYGVKSRRLSSSAKAYVQAHDAAHRTSPMRRLRQEVLTTLPQS